MRFDVTGIICRNYLKKGNKVLDLGSGSGIDANRFFRRDMNVSVFDINQNQDFNKLPLPFESNSFDCVFMSFSYRFVKDEKKFLEEAKRILKDDGIFVVYDTKNVGLRLLDFSPFNHVFFKRTPFYAFWPYERVLCVGKKFAPKQEVFDYNSFTKSEVGK